MFQQDFISPEHILHLYMPEVAYEHDLGKSFYCNGEDLCQSIVGMPI